jgi:hypothetical protein
MTVMGARGFWSPLFALAVIANGCSDAPTTDRSSSPSDRPNQTETAIAACPNGAEWCEIELDTVPSPLVRSLELPDLTSGSRCPADSGHKYQNKQFGGFALGEPPLQPLIAINHPRDRAAVKGGILRFRPSPDESGWYEIKTLWFARPSYHGGALIRGRQLNGASPIRFGESPSLTDPYLSAGPTANGDKGFREWPGATWIRAPGCYAWQIDGLDFSEVIVFKAEFEG